MRLPVRPADRRTARAADWQDPDWERSRARCIADACYERTFGRLLFERMKPVTGSARIIKLNGLARSDQEDPKSVAYGHAAASLSAKQSHWRIAEGSRVLNEGPLS